MLRAKRDILRRSSIGGMFTHRTATPGRVGIERRLRPRRARCRSTRTSASTPTSPARAARARDGDNLSYRGFFDYNADRTACRSSASWSSRTSCPRSASCAAPTCAATSAWRASARGRRAIRNLRKLTTQASLNYITNNQNRLDTREQVGQFQTEFTNSDVASVTYTDSFERLVRPFAIAPGVTLPVGAYDFHTTQLSATPAASSAGSRATSSTRPGTFYNGDRQSIARQHARACR